MAEEQKAENKVIKMQKLRRAVDRLRNMRSGGEPPAARRQSWLARLKERLGLAGKQKESGISE